MGKLLTTIDEKLFVSVERHGGNCYVAIRRVLYEPQEIDALIEALKRAKELCEKIVSTKSSR